ncbi:fibronectin-binding autotransporter adhesin [Luteibacter sp. UNCMF331Sha3.1]|uniref:autotransporter-associated beta strand repeat-containing protein n=1 Tax=Luteibacter sp. UNCMF331Sha3.1 TaxID=1502760 RepID=UPI0008D5AEB5|nr:autotransporter-associated beta strand repeat-containing protein [Luteibacter sp. UNCMF331Sha3.1]SEN21035.1 fibronectin-binding autotransporter adhesin [Luteibacter sp. UNCMF331Sha3.1]
MNRAFRIVWSRALGTWVVASELAGRHGKGRGRAATKGVDERASASRGAAGAWTLRVGLLMALGALHAPEAHAVDRYWDFNGGSAGSGGTGTWNTSSPYWNSAADGIAGPFVVWNNAGLDNAVFAGTAGSVTLSGALTANAVTFNTTGYSLGGGTLTLAGTTPGIAVNTGTSTIDSVIAGSAGLTKSGGGGIVLNGANTFSGDVNVTGGTLGIKDDAALGAAGNGVILANGTGLTVAGSLAATRKVTIAGTAAVFSGGNAGAATITGPGGVSARSGVTMSNAASDYRGATNFFTGGTYGFTSIGNLGEASSLGAPTGVAEGTVVVQAGGGLGGTLIYTGSGNASNRGFRFVNTSSGSNQLRNSGSGTLKLSGDIATTNAFNLGMSFNAVTADFELTGTISSASARTIGFVGSAGRTIVVNGDNTYSGPTSIGTITVKADSLTNTGTTSSFGTGIDGGINIAAGTLSYTGGATTSDRALTVDGSNVFANDGTGGLDFSGATNFATGGNGTDSLTLGGTYGGTNTFSGILAGTGSLVADGTGTWVLGGANTFAGTTTVRSGTLVAGSAGAFGTTKGLIVNGGTLDLNDLAIAAPSLAGTGGIVDLGSGTLTLNATTGATTYGGRIAGTGGLSKLGAGTQTLTGSNTYTGSTSIGGGTLALDFSAPGAPTGNIVSSASSLSMAGGVLSIKGRAAANGQSFNGLAITAGSNRINATSGTGGSLTVGLGAIDRTGGLMDFGFDTGTTLTTTHADGALGGWATVNGTDYAQVSGGVITAFTSYANKDDASQWLTGDIVSDEGNAPNTAYFGTLAGSVALGGLKYAAAAGSTVNVGAANTLSVDGSIIVSPAAGVAAQRITGGSLTGGAGGSPLGVLQNSGGTLTIASAIVDNGGPTSFVSGGSGTGSVVLSGTNTYTGSTTVSGGTLSVGSIGNGGAASSIGASGSGSVNLVIENGTLRYTGPSTTSDRGFTLVNGGPARTIQVDGTANLAFGGVVTSPDDAGFTKTGSGTLTLSNGANDFVGPLTVAAGVVSTGTLSNGGVTSGIGAGTGDPASLVLQSGGALQYTGGTTSTDRGFTVGAGNGRIDVSQATSTLTIGGTAVGAGGLIKDGAGTLVLSGNNTYTGGNTVNAGVLRAGSNLAFGGQANGTGSGQMTVNAGATLDVDGKTIWVRGLNGSGAVALGPGLLQINGSGTFGGAVSGSGGVAVAAGATQSMNGCGNTYTGATSITSAAITTDCLANGGLASGIGASTSASTNLVFTSGTLTYTGASVNIDRGAQLSSLGGFGVTNVSTVLGFGGIVQGTGGMQKTGAGTLVFSGANTYSGGSRVRAGTLRAGHVDAFGTGIMSLDDTAGVALDLDGFDTGALYLVGGGSNGGVVDLANATFTVTNGGGLGAAIYGGVIMGTGNFTKNGNSGQALTGVSSTYDGVTTVNGGVLQVASIADGGLASSIGASGNAASNLVINGGTLQYVGTGNTTDRALTLGASPNSAIDASGTGAVQFTSTDALAFSAPGTAQTVTLTGTSTANNGMALRLSDNGAGKTSVRKTGTGTWILRNPASSYTGPTTILGGVLGVDKLSDGSQASSIGQSSNAAANLVIGSSATLRYTGTGDTTDRLFTLSTGASVIESSGTGAIVFRNTGSAAYAGTGSRTLGLGGTNTDLNVMGGTIIDANATSITTLAKNDAGTWALTGTNTYTGNTVINGGILQLGTGGTTGSVASANIIVAAGTLAFDRSNAMTIAGTISGGGDVRQLGSGTTILTAANTYTGGTRIDGGTLQLGNGGAIGSILGDVVDNGVLAFDRSDVYGFGGLIAGTGGVTQSGSGTTVLAHANSYKGATQVSGGTLLINGDQSAATGATTVQNGGTLGGRGIIGGSVTVANGGTFNPGDAGAAGTLTVNGAFALAANATMNYQFGQANVIGGPLNDLTVVHGNLTLDGTLNVATTPGGSFGPGLYRIVSYDGALTDNGLALGTTPGGTFQIQTSIAKQVNLLNTGGLTLNFWDGPSGHLNNTIDGGTGVWQSAGGNDNWADPTGQVNAPYTNGEFGIFAGMGGIVTVDNGTGAVTSSGMQFAVDGYIVAGDTLTLGGLPNIVRVGDGTSAGAGMTATIDATLAGTGGLVKDDLGLLVLGGNNTYTGGTSVADGTLQVSADANLGDAAGGLTLAGGTLRNTNAFASARDVTLDQGNGTFDTLADLSLTGAIGGSGALVKTGAGTLTLAGANSYAGGTSIDGGMVSIAADANLGNAAGPLSLDGGTLRNTAAVTSGRTVSLGAGGGTFEALDNLTFTTGLSGAGALTKTGAGNLILAANATYTGGTTIAEGTLQLGDGGTTGTVAGDIANNGILVFDRYDTFAFGGLVSGNGAMEQRGAGTTVLTGNNTYAGSTAVRGGGLFVDGDQSAATGGTTVDAGATLGGKGTIGGDVTLADGATLSPGALGDAPGTLSIRGDLALNDTSTLAISLGQANVVGGPLNDLVQVDGDLTLDGVLNVSVPSNGTFDPGIYRIVGYTGALNDNGLTIGSVPTPDYYLQTSIAQQVNLLNTNGLQVDFWDGNGGRGDGEVAGGDGTWQNTSGNDNWTLVDGSANAPYRDASFAIFAANGGTVTVDDSLGAVTTGGMQFATDGYRVEGDDIAVGASPAVIRVGDGTTAGTAMTATIASVLTGTGGIAKSDLGTLVLAADNTYTGGTSVTGGVLQLGEGGTSGSILGDVVNNGTLAFDRSDTLTFAGAIGGAGGLSQRGTGTTVLTANNGYTGATTVESGTLIVNGDQSAATGTTSVLNGATLGGTGTIGGNVTVGDGATLSPGQSAGTLTINGSLALGASAVLDYELGQAGTPGGALNDLTVVHGDLTLDGTLNVTATPGGTFGAGVYRLFGYDGTLTDNGLSIGAVPTADVFVQTSLAHQVNLVNTDGLTLSFWDGPGHANDGAIAGGTGTWRLADNDYWTEASGSLNAPYSNGSFAVFGGTGGKVTVDDGNGLATVSGMQFAADGYAVTGDAIALAGGATSIRVGDGTTTGAGMTATIDAALTGGSLVVKDDLGTLVLDGANTYGGGTDVRAGTLQVANDGNLGAAIGYLAIDDATLHTTGSFATRRVVALGGDATIDTDEGTTLTVDQGIAGHGSLTKAGAGALVLGAASSYGGATVVSDGTLAAGVADAFDTSSAVTVERDGTLGLAGHAQHLATLTNAGRVTFGTAPGTTLTVKGDYAGQDGVLVFDAALGDDASSTDRLVVAGSTSGNTTVQVNNVGGAGAQTTQGIRLIDVQGASNGTFALKGDYVFQGDQAVVAGAYAYRLFKNGTDTADGDWYLRSALASGGDSDPDGGAHPLYQPGVPLYEAYAGVLQQVNALGTLFQRTGDRHWSGGSAPNDMSPGDGTWMRVEGGDQSFRPESSTSGTRYDVSSWTAEAGIDATLGEGDGGTLVAGGTLRYGRYQSNARSVYGQGRLKTDGYGIGGALTWFGDNGVYVDGQARWTRFDTDLRSTTLARSTKDGNKANGYAVGVEAGRRFGLSDRWSIVPQAQLTYGKVSFDSFDDAFGAHVSQRDGRSATGRAGVLVDYRSARQGAEGAIATHVYAIGNVYRNFSDAARVAVAGTDFTTRNERLWGGFGLGTSRDWADGRYAVYGEVQASKGLQGGDSHAVSATVGFRMHW